MADQRSGPDEGDLAGVHGDGATEVARRLALARERHELRGERDRLLVGLAREGGTAGVARSLGIEERQADVLLRGARARLDAAPPEFVARRKAQITARRLRAPLRALRGSGSLPTGPGGDAESRPDRAGTRPRRIGEHRPGARERSPDRWAFADEHYEALGRMWSDPGERPG
jgi:hypothetical protein